jgi:uncharacterized protein YhaN
MRIQRLTLERYGLFTDRVLTFHPEAALHIVYGANEAGKTSALSAIEDLLFGFAGRTDYDFQHDSKSLRIGGALLHSSGRAITVRRRKGNKNTLLDESDQSFPDDTLTPFLDGVSRAAFNREFGLTAQALREGGLELLAANGQLADTLAASSASMTMLSRARQRLLSEADDLFTARRSGSKPFYLTIDRRDAADRALRDAIVTREAVRQLENALREEQQHLEALTLAHKQSGARLALLQRASRVRTKLARLETLGAELETFSDLQVVSAQSLAEWQNALEMDAALGRDQVALDAARAADQAEIAALAVDETLLSEGAVIDGLRERLGAVRKATDDLPRRRQARDAARAALEDNARRLGLSSHVELLERLPSDPALAQARDLIGRIKETEQKMADAGTRRDRTEQELRNATTEGIAFHTTVDPEPLRQRFEAFGFIPVQANQLHRARASLGTETEALTAASASLNPSPGKLNELRALSLPDETVIARHASIAEANQNKEQRLNQALAALDTAILATEAELASLSGARSPPTHADLVNARRERDVHFDTMQATLNTEPTTRAAHLAVARLSSEKIDAITDLLLTDTERVIRQEAAQQRHSGDQAERKRNVDALAELQARIADAEQAWKQQWKAAGIMPRPPAEMRRWRERLDDILGRLVRCDAQKTEIAALEAGLETGKRAVIAFLEHVGRQPDRALSAETLFREARSRFEELQAAWADAKARAATQQRIERDLNEAVAAREAANGELGRLHQSWASAMKAIGLAADTTTAQAEAALLVWHATALPRASYEREGRSVEGIEADLAAFDAEVLAVANRAAPHLKGQTAQETLASLSEAFTATRNASQALKRLLEADAKREASRKSIEAQRAAFSLILDSARQKFSVSDSTAVTEAIIRASDRLRLESERLAARRDLLEIADGHDEAALRREQSGLDLDTLSADIAREAVQQQGTLDDIATASAACHQRQIELESLLKGRSAASLAAERAEANAELLSIAERWLLRSAAARLAGRAIERYRAKLQNPLIARASELFAAATGGSFAGLGIDYDDDQPVLVAQRNATEKVSISGLSEGTRDQLFLTFRLALLEHRTSEPLPFIGDDLLTSFDDTRTLAMLRLLAIAGGHRQIILFTHHQHVADMARTLSSHPIDIIAL